MTGKSAHPSKIRRVALKPEQQAKTLDRRVRRIEKQQKHSFIELGKILCKMQDGALWKLLKDENGEPFRSFERYVITAAPVCRAGAFQAMAAVRELSREIPVKELREIDRANIEVLRHVPRQKRVGLIQDAKQLSNREFRKQVQRKAPESHIESLAPLKFKPTQSQREKIDEAIEAARWVYELSSREEALECLSAAFLAGLCEREGCEGLSVAESYQRWLSGGSRAIPAEAVM